MFQRNSDGSITIFALAITATLLMLAVPVLWFGGLFLLNHKLSQVSDLVASAAAAELVADEPAPCAVAKQIANLNGVVLGKCQPGNGAIQVWVSTTIAYPIVRPIRGALPNQLTANSKAGLVLKPD
ncbi:MAG: flp pilus-assembly TadE/G-like family protein [Actinomycetales bacterium]|nr:flp pilus-assembly TadE/G-like family protein [Actinomycetales bacterium]